MFTVFNEEEYQLVEKPLILMTFLTADFDDLMIMMINDR